jgi:hypothetical protein
MRIQGRDILILGEDMLIHSKDMCIHGKDMSSPIRKIHCREQGD